MLDDRVSRAALAISLLLHGALVAPMWKRWSPLGGDSAAATAPLDEPMVFHLVDPQDGLDAKPDATTPNVSDANRRAAQPDAPEDLPLGEAFHAGQSPVPSTPRPAGARSAPVATPPREAARADDRPREDARELPRDESGEGRTDPRLALGPTRIGARPTAPASPGDRLPAPEVDQRLTRAEAGSAFTLNTTSWEWAPYMQRLKARIEQHISPPAAFYYGTAAWISRVRFRIGPDGRLLEFRLLDHRGVENLQYVALDAITGAADYEPLPPGFPEPYLEITGNFYFNVFPAPAP